MSVATRRIAAALSVVGITGCGSGGLGGGGLGQVDVLVVAYGGEDAAAGSEVGGTLEIEAQTALLRGNIPLDVSSGIEAVTLDLASSGEGALASTSVFSGVYRGVRIVFTSVTARVSGPDLEEPVTLTVDFGGGTLAWEEIRTILVDEDGVTTLLIELRADEWLDAASGGVVPREAFEDALRLTFRRE